MDTFSFTAIGVIHSCFKEKFGIPRQPGLAPAAQAELEIFSPYNRPEAFGGLQSCSHVWIQFVFHGIERREWKPTVRPPRLGGNQRMGVFATRSTHRPNPIGLSVVKLDEIIGLDTGDIRLRLSGVDLLDGTPVLDIKPYLPYVDVISDASYPFADELPECIEVKWQELAEKSARRYAEETCIDLPALIEQVLRQDPRPAYQQPDSSRIYGMQLYELNIQWRYILEAQSWKILVTNIETVAE